MEKQNDSEYSSESVKILVNSSSSKMDIIEFRYVLRSNSKGRREGGREGGSNFERTVIMSDLQLVGVTEDDAEGGQSDVETVICCAEP